MKKNNTMGNDLAEKAPIKHFLWIMRTTFILLFTCVFCSMAEIGHTQNARVTINKRNSTLNEVLNEIEKQTDYLFIYNDEINTNEKVSVKAKQEAVSSVLNTLLKNKDIDYSMEGNHIILSMVEKATLTEKEHQADIVQQQKKQITGKITDEQGEPIIGANIVEVGTSNGTITDIDGNFSLDVGNEATIRISYIGYLEQEIKTESRSSFKITLIEDTQALEEVIVVGYGTQKKANITGSVDMVTSEQLVNKPVSTVGHALQGVISNLNIEIPSGRPGTKPTFNVRGYESINGGSPLILVDGIPRDINDINPNEIESISVLKDASAAAVYGARGAFGVILVQTKQPSEQNLQVNVHARYSGEIPIFKMDMVTDPYVHMIWGNKAYQRGSAANEFPEFRVEAAKKWSENPTPENAWLVHEGTLYWVGGGEESLFYNRFFRNVIPKFEYSADVQGGTKNTKYYVSFSSTEEQSIFKPEYKGEKFKRINADLKVELNVSEWLTLYETVSFSNNQLNEPHYYGNQAEWNMLQRFGIAYYTGGFPSTDHFDEPDYPGRDYSLYEGMYIGQNHPIPYFQRGGRDIDDIFNTYFTQGIKINPFKNFEIRGDFTYRLYNRRREQVQSEIERLNGIFDGTIDLMQDNMLTSGYSTPTFVVNQYDQNQYYFLNLVGEYEPELSNSLHSIKTMVGFNQEWNTNKYGYLRAYDMITPSIQSIAATSGEQNTNSSEVHLALRGVFSRINYNYDNRYLIELSGRYDGTSRFPQNDRFGFFPSGSIGWRISEEVFMGNIDFLSNLMLRASYGELGNQGIGGYYPYLSTMNMGMSDYLMGGNRIPYVNPSGLVSPSLTWETARTTNFGINVGLFNQSLIFEFDTYKRETLNMLMRYAYPDLLGASAPQENGADLANRGWEFKATYMGKVGSDLAYNLTFNLADNKTEITKFDGNPTGAVNDYYVGKIIGEIWGYETVGIFQSEEEVENAADQSQIASLWRPGDIQYADLNDDGKINPGNNTLDNPGDRRVIGNSSPRYTYGLNLDVTYKNFGLSAFFQGVGKRDWYPNRGSHSLFWPFNAQGIQQYMIDESWSEENRDAYFYAPTRYDGRNNEVQTRYLQDASYLRIKNVTLRYDVPTTVGMLEGIGIRKLQVYITGYNLAEITNMHKAYDPEYLYTNVAYPLSRSFSLGVRLGF